MQQHAQTRLIGPFYQKLNDDVSLGINPASMQYCCMDNKELKNVPFDTLSIMNKYFTNVPFINTQKKTFSI